MNHGQAGYRRAEIGDTRTDQTSQVNGSQIGISERDAGHPGGNASFGVMHILCANRS